MNTFDARSIDRDAPLYRGIVQQVRAQIASGVLAPGDRLPPTRELARLLGVNANTVAHAYSLLEAEGIVEGRPGRGTFIVPSKVPAADDQLAALAQRALGEAAALGYSASALRAALDTQVLASQSEQQGSLLRFQGSHDPALDVLWALAARARPGLQVHSTNVGSLWGLVALERGEAYLAGAHLFDPESGEYNLPWVRRVLPGRKVALLHMAGREQGLISRDGKYQALEDIAGPGVRFVNRQRGSGTRLLLDHHLGILGIRPEAVSGYEREEHTHSAVASAVAEGRANVGLGTYAAAKALDLCFAPLATEQYELLLLTDLLDSPEVRPVLTALRSPEFSAVLRATGGYDTTRTGEVRFLEPSV